MQRSDKLNYQLIDDYDPSIFPLSELPFDVLQDIAAMLPTEDRYALARVFSKTIVYGSAGDAHWFNIFKNHAAGHIRSLFKCALLGDEQQVLRMLDHHPELLLESVKSTSAKILDITGKPYKCMTLLQILICVCDSDMIEKILPYFAKIYANPEKVRVVIASQIKAGFILGIQTHLEASSNFWFDPIMRAIKQATAQDVDAALLKQNNGSALCLALTAFRDDFTKHMHREEVFNTNNALAAIRNLEIIGRMIPYSDAQNIFESKMNLYFRQVFGYTLRHFAANFLQKLAQNKYYIKITTTGGNPGGGWGVTYSSATPAEYRYDLGGEKKLTTRSFKLRTNSAQTLFSGISNANSGLGYDCAVRVNDNDLLTLSAEYYSTQYGSLERYFDALTKITNKELKKALDDAINPSSSYCVIQ